MNQLPKNWVGIFRSASIAVPSSLAHAWGIQYIRKGDAICASRLALTIKTIDGKAAVMSLEERANLAFVEQLYRYSYALEHFLLPDGEQLSPSLADFPWPDQTQYVRACGFIEATNDGRGREVLYWRRRVKD